MSRLLRDLHVPPEAKLSIDRVSERKHAALSGRRRRCSGKAPHRTRERRGRGGATSAHTAHCGSAQVSVSSVRGARDLDSGPATSCDVHAQRSALFVPRSTGAVAQDRVCVPKTTQPPVTALKGRPPIVCALHSHSPSRRSPPQAERQDADNKKTKILLSPSLSSK